MPSLTQWLIWMLFPLNFVYTCLHIRFAHLGVGIIGKTFFLAKSFGEKRGELFFLRTQCLTSGLMTLKHEWKVLENPGHSFPWLQVVRKKGLPIERLLQLHRLNKERNEVCIIVTAFRLTSSSRRSIEWSISQRYVNEKRRRFCAQITCMYVVYQSLC